MGSPSLCWLSEVGVREPSASPVQGSFLPMLLRDGPRQKEVMGLPPNCQAGNTRSWKLLQVFRELGQMPSPSWILDQSLGSHVGSRVGIG